MGDRRERNTTMYVIKRTLYGLIVGATGFLTIGTPLVLAMRLTPPSISLKFGDNSTDVALLQKILNESPATQVAQSGAGSPGNESTYFGAKTLDAVKRFQNLYANDILHPNNLSAPTGYVGKSTLRKLADIESGSGISNSTTKSTTEPKIPVIQPLEVIAHNGSPASSTIPAPIPLTPNMVIPPGVNPNSINLEYAISAVEQEGVKEGMSRSQLDAVEASMRTSAASTTDFRKHFFDTGKFIATSSTSIQLPSASKDTVMFKLLSFFGLVKEADAATGLPFGGKVYYISPCTCTLGAAWMMIISPLPPTYANILTYIVGTELFLSYNLPFSVALLGFYTPGVPACVMGFYPACAPAPNFGVIQPVVGSAPI